MKEKFKDVTEDDVANQEYLDLLNRNKIVYSDYLVVTAIFGYVGAALYTINMLYWSTARIGIWLPNLFSEIRKRKNKVK